METTLRSTFPDNAALMADKGRPAAVAGWLIAALIVLFGFRYAREVVSAVLMKLYEVLIQENAARL